MSDYTRPTPALRDLDDDAGSHPPVPQSETQPMVAHAVEHGLRLLSGRYLLQRKIASGGMASVWRARDEVLARTVAVKLLHDHLAADPDFRERFRREAISAARLSHQFIVGIFDSGVDGDHVFLVMEYVEGMTLRDLIINHGALSNGRAADIGEKVARALDYAHRHGLVHRDVKPANILLGDDGSVELGDFGIAKADQVDDLTKTGMVLGTAAYVAPEQIMAQPTDSKADQYSLGCVLYEMLTGRQPFKAETAVATAAQRLDARVPAVRTLRPEVPPGLEAVVVRAMALRPEDRFPSCGHLADVLAAYADGRGGRTSSLPVPVTVPLAAQQRPAAPAGRPAAAGRMARRMVLPVLGIAVFMLGLAGASMSGLFETTPPDESAPEAAVAAQPAELDLEEEGLLPFDPGGEGQERQDLLPFLIDDSLDTDWRTEGYERENFGGIKDGVGFVIDLGEDATIEAVKLDVATEGFGVELRTAADVPRDLDDSELVVPRQVAGATVHLRPEQPVTARYLVIWLTGPLPRTGAEPNPYRASISEVNVLGTRGAPAA